MGKYNEKFNDDFLLKTNLLGISDYKNLELAEAFVFSLRATQIEQGTYKSTHSIFVTSNVYTHIYFILFLQAYALSKGVNNFTDIDQDTYLKAMIQSVTDTELLENLFLNTIEFI